MAFTHPVASEHSTCTPDTIRRVIDIYGVTVTVAGPTLLVDRDIWPYLSMWTPKGGASEPPSVELAVHRDPESEGGTYWARRGADVVASGPSGDVFVTNLQGWLDREVLLRLDAALTPIHAGVVAVGDGAIVLPASSGSGKTSLVAALLERGARYYSDELALIDAAGRVVPYPRPLMVRGANQVQLPVLPARFDASIGQGPLPIALIATLQYRPGESLRLKPITNAEAVLLLLRHSFAQLPRRAAHPPLISTAGVPPKPLSATIWPAIVRAAASADSYSGVRGEAAEAADAILQLAASRAVPPAEAPGSVEA